MKVVRLHMTLALVVSFAFGATAAFATPITVVNPNFQTLPSPQPTFYYNPNGYFDESSVPGWTASEAETTAASGQWFPNSSVFVGYDGYEDVGYSNGATLFQTVTPTVVLGEVYTLTVDIGDRPNEPFGGGADILVDGVEYDATGVAVPGYFTTYTATYTGLAGDVGDAITIQLTDSPDAQGSYTGVALDGVPASLVTPPSSPASVTPEPSSISLLGLGLVAVLGFSFSKRTA